METKLQSRGNISNGTAEINPNFDLSGITPEAVERELTQSVDSVDNALCQLPFPVEIFPQIIQQVIRGTNENLDFPVDFIGASIIYAVSVAVGNTHRVEVKKGFQETAVIYLGIIGPPGSNKTHPLTFAVEPITEQDKKTYRQYEQQRKQYEDTVNLSKKERQEQGIEEPVKPVWQKYLLTDFTPEALAEVHRFNLRGIGIYVDELAQWFKNFNRYNGGSETEFWLSAWNSKPINIDRKTGNPIYISKPFISIAGTIQNGILNELAKESRTQNGFIDRILFVIPDNLQKPHWSEAEIDPSIQEGWSIVISNLLSLSVPLDETANLIPQLLPFTPEAKRILFDWQKTNADQCNEDESIAGIFSKLEMYAARLALILEMMRWACGESDKQAVGVEAITGSLKLVEYFKRSAIKVQSIISSKNPLDKLPGNKQNLYNSLPQKFTTAEGLLIAESLEVKERRFKEFLKNRELFIRVTHGNYEKRI